MRLLETAEELSQRGASAEMDQDALLAQLLGMGFGMEEIERCQVAMATSLRPYSLQEATEW